MTAPEQTPGEQLDAALADLRTRVDGLAARAGDAGEAARAAANEAIDELQAQIAELSAAVDAAQGQ